MKSMRPILWRISTSHMCEVRKKIHGRSPVAARLLYAGLRLGFSLPRWTRVMSFLLPKPGAFRTSIPPRARRLWLCHGCRSARPRQLAFTPRSFEAVQNLLRDSERLRFVHWRGIGLDALPESRWARAATLACRLGFAPLSDRALGRWNRWGDFSDGLPSACASLLGQGRCGGLGAPALVHCSNP